MSNIYDDIKGEAAKPYFINDGLTLETNASLVSYRYGIVTGHITHYLYAGMSINIVRESLVELIRSIIPIIKLIGDIVIYDSIDLIRAERERQTVLYGTQDHDIAIWEVILAEEYGEMNTAICDYIFDYKEWYSDQTIIEEATHTAAVAVQIIEKIDEGYFDVVVA